MKKTVIIKDYAKWLFTPIAYTSTTLIGLTWLFLDGHPTFWKLSLLMQVSGGLLSSIALLSTALENKINTPLEEIKIWVRKRPLRKKTNSASFSGSINSGIALTALSINRSFPDNGTDHEKIEWLQREISSIKSDTHLAIGDLQREIEIRRIEIKKQEEQNHQLLEDTNKKIRNISTGNFYKATSGFVLLTLGSILSLCN